MLYFYLNTKNFVDPMINGIANDLGTIQSVFLNVISSILLNIGCYYGSWSGSAPFKNVPELRDKKWTLISIDDESVKIPIKDILAVIEEAHSIKLVGIEKSLNDMGLHFDYVTYISNKEVNEAWTCYLAENNQQYLNESIGNRNMDLPQKIAFVSTELLNIGSDGNTLIIVDPYLFPKRHDEDYAELFEEIIKASRVSSVDIITTKKYINKKMYENIKDRLTIPMIVYTANDLHDRWWIIEETQRGLLSGTSLNGVGKGKLATITELSKEDIEICFKDIRRYCKKENIFKL